MSYYITNPTAQTGNIPADRLTGVPFAQDTLAALAQIPLEMLQRVVRSHADDQYTSLLQEALRQRGSRQTAAPRRTGDGFSTLGRIVEQVVSHVELTPADPRPECEALPAPTAPIQDAREPVSDDASVRIDPELARIAAGLGSWQPLRAWAYGRALDTIGRGWVEKIALYERLQSLGVVRSWRRQLHSPAPGADYWTIKPGAPPTARKSPACI
jgi:hypothetical protein